MTAPQIVHATSVAWDGRAVLITGQSGAGKSALGLQLLGLGCTLVADDRVTLTATDGTLTASCPPTIAGLIEARGIGILNAEHIQQASIQLVVDLDSIAEERLPQRRVITLLGCDIPLILGGEGPLFAAAVLQTLKGGWSDR
ncbi:HPr kinase/phosphorylase [Loktanella sp. Alg231-35]|uniref:HPr kinase/phosphorylase n=1 Tax=Loktanella sp. Alg231-35 TaxID=1922220 RepID=UPI000D54F3A7|nr:HPr kinase/phosphatase C-terminal domain-containing protein [Loktanella sp. Alg231-35]